MLTEFHGVKQEATGRRRWFASEALELIVWEDAAGGVGGFQLCYAEPDGERALTWRAAEGFTLSRVDAGDTNPLRNETPVLRPVPDGEVPWSRVGALFAAEDAGLEPALRELIAARLAARR